RSYPGPRLFPAAVRPRHGGPHLGSVEPRPEPPFAAQPIPVTPAISGVLPRPALPPRTPRNRRRHARHRPVLDPIGPHHPVRTHPRLSGDGQRRDPGLSSRPRARARAERVAERSSLVVRQRTRP